MIFIEKKEYTTIAVPKRAVVVLDELIKTERGLDLKTKYLIKVTVKKIKDQEEDLKYMQINKMKNAWKENEGDAWIKLYLKQAK